MSSRLGLMIGSPPHMRGKAASFSALNSLTGITPAYAGKRIIAALCFKLFKDHPRICGEKHMRSIPCWYVWGSPPHMRGKASGTIANAAQTGITPAYAGKSSS